MGWNSANPIFEAVADELIGRQAEPVIIYQVCHRLIGELQALDWDTETESLRRYRDNRAIVLAFSDNGVYLAVQPSKEPPADAEPGTIVEIVDENGDSTYRRRENGAWIEITEREALG